MNPPARFHYWQIQVIALWRYVPVYVIPVVTQHVLHVLVVPLVLLVLLVQGVQDVQDVVGLVPMGVPDVLGVVALVLVVVLVVVLGVLLVKDVMGVPPVLLVEVVLDVPIGHSSASEVAQIMGEPISWAPGLPLRADAYECNFYQKD